MQSWTDAGGTTTLTYDVQGNLLAVNLPSGTTVAYLVDGRNRRIGRAVKGAVTHRWLYQGQLRPIAELDASGVVVTRFVYGARAVAPEYMIRGGITYRLITDQLGSVRLVVNSTSGAVAQRIDYDAWGQVVADTNPGFQPFGYAGGLRDSLTGFTRFGLRDYDAGIGRWMAKNPLAFHAGDSNFYAYVGNQPVNRIDPDGTEFIAAAGGAFIGGISAWAGARLQGATFAQTVAAVAMGAAVGGVIGLLDVTGGVLTATALAKYSVTMGALAGWTNGMGQALPSMLTGQRLCLNMGAIVGSAIGGAVSGAIGLQVASLPLVAHAASGAQGVAGQIAAAWTQSVTLAPVVVAESIGAAWSDAPRK